MQNRQQGRQLAYIGVGVIVLVLGIGFFLMNRSSGNSASANSSKTQPVLVASQAIPQGTVFKAGQNLGGFFTIEQIPNNLVPFGAYTNANQVQSLTKSPGCGPVVAAGCDGQITTTQTLYQGSPVVSGMFTALGQYRTSAGPSFAIPYGYVGIAVNFDAVNSVLGSVNPGDNIDLIASYHGQYIKNFKAPPQTQYVMNDLRVISVNSPPAVGATGTSPTVPSASTNAPSTTGATAAGGTLVLLVRFQQALVIQHLKDFGWQMSVVLRSARETSIQHFKTVPVTDKWFFVKTSNPLKANPGY